MSHEPQGSGSGATEAEVLDPAAVSTLVANGLVESVARSLLAWCKGSLDEAVAFCMKVRQGQAWLPCHRCGIAP